MNKPRMFATLGTIRPRSRPSARAQVASRGAWLMLGGAFAAFAVSAGIIMTIGANCLGMVVFVPLLSRHFVRRRGMAVAILQSANGFGRAASAPLVQLLISTIGWRETYLAQAVFMAAAVPLLAAQFRRAARYPTAAEPV